MSDSEAIPVLDLGVIDALRALDEGSGPGLFEELVDLFVTDAVAHVRTLESALATGDARLLERAAHTLKSSAAAIGAARLSMICKSIEFAGREGRAADLAALTEDARAAWAATVDALRAQGLAS